MTRRPRTCALPLAIAVAAALGGCGDSNSGGSSTTSTTAAGGLPGLLTTAPPWPANGERLRQRLRAIGLPALSEEGQVLHSHQHLDLFVDGRRVEVPANIGIDPGQRFISPLHTHDTTGILHVESPTKETFTLGQFFDVWGLRLDAGCIGGACAGAGKLLRAWIAGKPVEGDPARIVLRNRQEIVLASGAPAQTPKPVPSRYEFPAGL